MLIFRKKSIENLSISLPEKQFHNPHFVYACVLHSTTRVSLITAQQRTKKNVEEQQNKQNKQNKYKTVFFFLLQADTKRFWLTKATRTASRNKLKVLRRRSMSSLIRCRNSMHLRLDLAFQKFCTQNRMKM